MRERRPVIRHIATSFDGTVIAVAEFERHVQIWDVRLRNRIAAFESTLDFGGHRLAISRDGKVCAVGAYHVHGIALYNAGDGTELWRRKDLKKVQQVRIALDGQRLLCGFEGKSFEILNLHNGRSKTPPRGVQDVWESPYDPLVVLDRKRRDFKLMDRDNKEIASIPRTTFAALAFAFAPQSICISESGGPISCFELSRGKRLWQFDPPLRVHALELAYNEDAQKFVAITWPFEKGGDRELISLDLESGRPTVVDSLQGAHEHAFCCKGSMLVTSDGKIRDSTSAKTLGNLSFFADGRPH